MNRVSQLEETMAKQQATISSLERAISAGGVTVNGEFQKFTSAEFADLQRDLNDARAEFHDAKKEYDAIQQHETGSLKPLQRKENEMSM
jgi:predicted  nucleic acid-binding Zn-ribbon protein